MVDTNKQVNGVRRKLQKQESFKTYYEKNKERLQKRSLEYYHENKDGETYSQKMEKKAYQQWYYENIRKNNKKPKRIYKRKDTAYNKEKPNILDSFDFKITFNRNPNDLTLML